MAILKCKMCGGDLNIQDGMTVAECEYCGTKQTVPTAVIWRLRTAILIAQSVSLNE